MGRLVVSATWALFEFGKMGRDKDRFLYTATAKDKESMRGSAQTLRHARHLRIESSDEEARSYGTRNHNQYASIPVHRRDLMRAPAVSLGATVAAILDDGTLVVACVIS